jgi:prepilin-type N-terminal cleavage/methylation domain-containing protein
MRGFTLIELLISIAIVTLVAVAGLASFTNSRNVRELSSSGQNVLSILRLAQSRALAGSDNASWGVHFQQSQFVLYRGPTYAGSGLTETFLLPASIEIANIILAGGGVDVLFNRLDGKASQSGTLDVRVKSSTGTVFSITIDGSGKAYQTGTAPVPTGTRVIDTRHRTFDLNGTIKNSVTMLLTFSDPPNHNTLYPVVMLPLLPRTTFDWTGTVAVGGQNQTLRIHALSIIDTDTLLSVDRDCGKNTKQVKIALDTSDIATYNADCQNLTIWPFGGTVVEP